MVREDGTIDAGAELLTFPVYTSAGAIEVLGGEQEPGTERARAAWLAYLRARQLDERLGWRPTDAHFGGWGYAVEMPRKPRPGETVGTPVESNLSATAFALDALAAARVPLQDPAYEKALVFVKRCQNFAEDPTEADARFDDGGFFFRPGDAAKNKAGVAGKDRQGEERFSSYGGMTADGLRALLRCGLPADHPRVAAARRWLERNFAAHANPGRFAPDREIIRDATYYYYCRSVALSFTQLGTGEIDGKTGKVNWAEALAEELLRRQRPDGSWVNRFTDTKEDDPLVSTPSAAAALVLCRRALAHREMGR
jgi:squalene-hopene/tetraprenyl-beta-curcumene cyclase